MKDEIIKDRLERLDSKRKIYDLKGQKKHEFLNEFNTLFQTLGFGSGLYADITRPLLEKMCTYFAEWGARNLTPKDEVILETNFEKSLSEVLKYIASQGICEEYCEAIAKSVSEDLAGLIKKEG